MAIASPVGVCILPPNTETGETMKTIASLIGALAALALASSANADPAATRVETGALVGKTVGDIVVFRDIPYAAPPVGASRWKPPGKPLAWTGARDATANGPSCMQVMNAGGMPNAGGAAGPVSEDCLTLNVFAPKGAARAPVMLWIHGGSNLWGAGSIYDGSAFARDGVVFIAINYRMGAFGFFAHPALTKEAPGAQPLANYALMDQIAALKWVKRNAAAFGGDPGNVTVFGESAGAIDILALLGMPSADGLFNRAIMESNIGWGGAKPFAAQEANGSIIATRLGLAGAQASADQLRAAPADKLLAAQAGLRNLASTTIDGRMVTQSAYSAIAAGKGLDVPIVIGSNSFEASLIAGSPGVTPQTEADFTNGLAGSPARWVAGRFNAKGSPAWLYFFSYVRSASRATAPGAGHASEIPYAYNWFGPFGPPSDEDKAEAALMHSCWVAFAKTGAPACASGPTWPTYAADSDQLLEFGTGGDAVRTHFRKAEMDASEQKAALTKP